MREKNALKFIWSLIYPLLIFLIVSVAVQVAVTFLMAIILVIKTNGVDVDSLDKAVYGNFVYISIAIGIINIPVFAFLFRRDEKRFPEKKSRMTALDVLLIMIMGISFCMAGNMLIQWTRLNELFPYYQDELSELIYSGNLITSFLSIVVVAAVQEELLCRGLIYSRTRRYFDSKWIACLVSALVFALLHGNMTQGVYAFLIAILCVFVYDRYGRIGAPILLHGSANFISYLLSEVDFVANFVDEHINLNILGAVCFAIVVVCILAIRATNGFGKEVE